MGITLPAHLPGPKERLAGNRQRLAGSPLIVPLQGEGLHGPHMSLDTAQALLGSIVLGLHREQHFDVSNTGDYPLFIQRAFLVTGTPLMFPVLEDSCSGAILYPSEACAITSPSHRRRSARRARALLFITNTPRINVAGIDGIGVSARSVRPRCCPRCRTHTRRLLRLAAATTLRAGRPERPPPAVRRPRPSHR